MHALAVRSLPDTSEALSARMHRCRALVQLATCASQVLSHAFAHTCPLLRERLKRRPCRQNARSPTMTRCVTYTRTSSATNIGEDKDSRSRQLEHCRRHATAKRYTNCAIFDDPAVSGTDPLIARKGFVAMVHFCQNEKVASPDLVSPPSS